MRGFVIAATAWLAAGSSLAGEIVIPDLNRAMMEAKPGDASAAGCAARLERANTSNAADLFHGMAQCFAAGRSEDGNLLLLEGQMRATADMSSFAPRDAEATEIAGGLYMMIFYQLGGLGMAVSYEPPASGAALLARFAAWQPTIPDGYDPGWASIVHVDPAAYATTLKQLRDRRVRQVRRYVSQLADPRYRALEAEFGELQRRNPGGFEAGTPDAARSGDVLREMETLGDPSLAEPGTEDRP